MDHKTFVFDIIAVRLILARNSFLSAPGIASGKPLIIKYGKLLTSTIIYAIGQVHQVSVYNHFDEQLFWSCWRNKGNVLQDICEEVYAVIKIPDGCGGVSIQIRGDMLILYTE